MTKDLPIITIESIFETLADLLDYPGENWESLLGPCVRVIAARSDVFDLFDEFHEGTKTLSLSELQELYTRTFDLNPVCGLDIGYHLFGENYNRGVFLANLRETEEPFELGQDHQLPDYLPVLLRLLPKLDDEELRSALIVDCINPALEKMLKALSAGENPYRHLLGAVAASLKSEASTYRATVQRPHLPVLHAAAFSGTNTDLF